MIDVAHRGVAPACVGKPFWRALLPICSGRLPSKFLEDAIELRQRLKTRGEGNLAHAKIEVVQARACFLIARARDVFNKVHPGHLPELFTQMIRADVDRLCHQISTRSARLRFGEVACVS
jgi:hypothetical protein